jgi:Ras family protein A
MIILCYDISAPETLSLVKSRWKVLVETHFNYDEALPVLLLGLKRDLRTNHNVHPQEALRVAAEMRCDRYAECSALTGELVAEVFDDVVKMAVATTKGFGGGKSDGAACVMM